MAFLDGVATYRRSLKRLPNEQEVHRRAMRSRQQRVS